MKSNINFFILLSCLLPGIMLQAQTDFQIKYPGGRIALLHDGNFRDPDDFAALPMNLAILSAAGLNDKLVYLEHSHFIGCNDENMEQEMIISLEGAKERFGPFPNAEFFNYNRNPDEAKSALVEAINSSTASSPLWIICAGRMESLYRALLETEKAKRKHLILVSHSIWNEDYTLNRSPMDAQCTGMIHTWDDIKTEFRNDGIFFIESSNREIFPNDPHKLSDQNHTNDIYDFLSPENHWEWLKELGPDYQWLFSRNKIENFFDVSDSGMLWFVITGGIDMESQTKVGCETCGWRELKLFLNRGLIEFSERKRIRIILTLQNICNIFDPFIYWVLC
jgi:hypothetical protein